MNGQAAVSILAIFIGLSGYCFAADPEGVSHEQAAQEAVANRKLAVILWDETHQACAVRDWPKQSSIMKTINSQLSAQPSNNQKYSARFVYSSCQQMLSDVSFINGACFNKAPTQHEMDHINKTWKEDSQLCDAEIPAKLATLAEPSRSKSKRKHNGRPSNERTGSPKKTSHS